MEAADRDAGIHLAELLAAFSLATDLGLGQPMEHVLRSWRIAERLAEHLDADNLNPGAEVNGTVPLWKWIGDEPATTFSY